MYSMAREKIEKELNQKKQGGVVAELDSGVVQERVFSLYIPKVEEEREEQSFEIVT